MSPFSLRQLVRYSRGRFAFGRELKSTWNGRVQSNLSGEIEGTYVVSTDLGLFVVCPEGIKHISKLSVFGVAISGDKIFVAAMDGEDSVVFVGDSKSLLVPRHSFEWKELYRVPSAGHSGRIHQISVLGQSIWICNTAQNSYVKLNYVTGEWQGAFAPFRCSFGHPILKDHNHVNAISPHDNFLVFGAFRANKNAVFGVCGDGLVKIYTYKNMGIHDCIMSGESIIFSDSYRMFDPDAVGGCLYKDGSPLFEEYFDCHPAGFLRGVAGSGGEIVAGNSVTGARTERFSGNGEIIVFRNSVVRDRFSIPAAQIYDIIRLDGKHLDIPSSAKTFLDASKVLDNAFGPALETLDLEDLMIGPSGNKKFSLDDQGNLSEYLGKVRN